MSSRYAATLRSALFFRITEIMDLISSSSCLSASRSFFRALLSASVCFSGQVRFSLFFQGVYLTIQWQLLFLKGIFAKWEGFLCKRPSVTVACLDVFFLEGGILSHCTILREHLWVLHLMVVLFLLRDSPRNPHLRQPLVIYLCRSILHAMNRNPWFNPQVVVCPLHLCPANNFYHTSVSYKDLIPLGLEAMN
jgi:hypothetical protein